MGISSKNVECLHTGHCGLGLFALEDITEDEYIIEYTGNITKYKQAGNKNYVAMVTYKDKKGKNNTFFINGENSISLARCCNHSCVFNAKLIKVEKEQEKKQNNPLDKGSQRYPKRRRTHYSLWKHNVTIYYRKWRMQMRKMRSSR